MYEAKIENIRSRAVRESTAQKAKQAAVTNSTNSTQEGYDPNAAETVILEISVSDTGIGIPSDRLPKLFKSFSQIDISTARRYGGTGLGLAISSTLVNHMGGGLWVESEEGLGSRFALTIPILVAPNQPDTPGNRSSDGWTPLTSPPSPCSTSSEGTSGAQSVSTERSLDFTSPATGCMSPSQNTSHAQGYFSQHSSTRSTSPGAQPAPQGNTYKQSSIPTLAWAPPPPPVSLALGVPPIAKHPYTSKQDGVATSKPMVTRSQYANADPDSLAIPASGSASASPKLKPQTIDTRHGSAALSKDSQNSQSIPSAPRIIVGKPQSSSTTKPADDKQVGESSVPKASGSLLSSAATSGGQSVSHNRTSRASVAKQHHHHRRGGNVNEENVALAFPVKILLAEDNVLNQKIAISILKRLGYTGVEIANNGREVLDAMRRTRFDVIFVSRI